MMLFPIMPVIITQYNQPALMLGILAATYSLFQMIGAPILGAMSDKYGRKPLLLITQLGTFISWIILTIAFFLPETPSFLGIILPITVILCSRIIDGITGGNASVAQAMVADMTTKEERSRVFGFNGAIMGATLIIGPSLGAFSMNTSYGMAGTAILGACISGLALLYMFFVLQETLKEKKQELHISFQQLNIWSQVQKWKYIPLVKMAMSLKIFFFIGFTIYTTVSGLYLIDVFGFTPENIGYYLAFTGMFLIIHQIYSLKVIIPKTGDIQGFLLGQGIMAVGFITMALTNNIYVFTGAYAIAVLGIALSMNTLQAIFSTCVDEKSQGEIMGLSNGIESILMVIGPIMGTYLYGALSFSIYYVVALLAGISLLIYQIFFRKSCSFIQ